MVTRNNNTLYGGQKRYPIDGDRFVTKKPDWLHQGEFAVNRRKPDWL